MVKEVEMYVAVCDSCGAECEYGEWYCVGDRSIAIEWAMDAEWHTDSGEACYCPNCFELDENGEIIIKPRL